MFRRSFRGRRGRRSFGRRVRRSFGARRRGGLRRGIRIGFRM